MRTVIGYGSPKAGTSKVHGEALGAETRQGDQEEPGLARGQDLLRPRRGARELGTAIKPRGKKAHEAEWDAEFDEYKKAYPEPAG